MSVIAELTVARPLASIATFAEDSISMLVRTAAATPMPIIHSPSRTWPGVALRFDQPNFSAPSSRQRTSWRVEKGIFSSGSSLGSFCFQKSIGSTPSLWHSSSSAASVAIMPTASPGARIEPDSSQSSSTRSWLISRFSPE